MENLRNYGRKRYAVAVVFLMVLCLVFGMTASAKNATVKKGAAFTKGDFKYQVTTLNKRKRAGNATLAVPKKKTIKTAKIPDTVKYGDYRLTVTAIGDNAFKNCKQLTRVEINKSTGTIGENAFYGCVKLRNIYVCGTKLTRVGQNALKAANKKVVVTAPSEKEKELFYQNGQKNGAKGSVSGPGTESGTAVSAHHAEENNAAAKNAGRSSGNAFMAAGTVNNSAIYLKRDGQYRVFQGACTDGRYAYAILENQKVPTDTPGVCRSEGLICKIDMESRQEVARSGYLPLGHGNDIAYNPKTGLLMVVNNKDCPNRITLVDPGKLSVMGTVDIGYKIYGLSYNEARDCYVAGISGTYDFVIMDADFRELKLIHGTDTGLVKQGIDSDNDFIYFLQDRTDFLPEKTWSTYIICYSWDGEYAGTYSLAGNNKEAEAIFHIGDAFHVGFNVEVGYGGGIWPVSFSHNC